jgi:hypothetical protein
MEVAQSELAATNGRLFEFIKSALILCVIFVIVVPTRPLLVGAGLDPSWIFGINLAHAQRMIFGRDIIFTYGPLGYLIYPVFPESEPWAVFAFEWAIALVTAYSLWMLCRRARHWTESCLYLGAFWIYSAFTFDAQVERLLGAIIALTLLIAARLDEKPWLDCTLLFFLAAVTLLSKFNLGIIATIAAFYFAAVLVYRDAKALKRAGAAVAVWLATLIGLYWIADGSLASIGPFVRNSLAIANGYSAAMGLAGPLWIAVAAVAICIGLWLIVPLAAGSIRRVLWGMPLLIAIGFLCFKSAMVRQDGHALPFPFESAALALMMVALASTLRSRIVIAIFVLAMLGVGALERQSPLYPPVEVDRLTGLAAWNNLHDFVHWPATVHNLEADTRRALVVDQLPPGFSEYVRGKKVAVYPTEIAMIRANQLPWQPLPIIQAYSAYTPYLDSVNAQALDGPAAPGAAILEWNAIDDRQPFYETPESWWALLDWYELKLRSHNWPQNLCLLNRRAKPRFAPPVAAGSLVARWDQTITLPQVADDEGLMMQADAPESLRGFMKRELFRAPIVMVRATLRSGFIESKRVLRASMTNGVLVSDWPKSLGPLAAMFAPGSGFTKDRVVTIAFHSDTPLELGRAIKIRWFKVKLRTPPPS